MHVTLYVIPPLHCLHHYTLVYKFAIEFSWFVLFPLNSYPTSSINSTSTLYEIWTERLNYCIVEINSFIDILNHLSSGVICQVEITRRCNYTPCWFKTQYIVWRNLSAKLSLIYWNAIHVCEMKLLTNQPL